MFFQQDIVDNFFMFTNSKPTVLHPDNNNDAFSVSFPHRKDFSVNEAWEVAVTSLTMPYWITNPTSLQQTNWINIEIQPHGDNDKVGKLIHARDGYFTSRLDYINSLKLEHPVFVFKDEGDQSLHTIDFDDYFVWRPSPTTDNVTLDTSNLFDDYPETILMIKFSHMVHRSIHTAKSKITLTRDDPVDHQIRSGGRFYDTHFDLKDHVLVHSNLTGSPENPQKIVFHSAEINKPANHTHYGTVNLVPERLEYHKVTLENFSHINFEIADIAGHRFYWLHETPVSLGLHFRKRYYIDVYR